MALTVILQQLSSLLKEGFRLVFPSEVVSSFFLRALLTGDYLTALRQDRMLSWDQWKKILLSPDDSMPASVITRYCFAQTMLQETSNNYGTLSEIAEILPFLPFLRDHRTQKLSVSYIHDLFPPYHKFLQENHLFEMEWQPVPSHISSEFYFIVPELCMDFPRYQKAIDSTRIISLQDFASPPSQTTRRFTSAREEITTVMQEVYDLLHQGKEAEEIAITVGNLPLYAPHLQNAADQYCIPLHIAQSQPLSMTEGSRIFPLLEEVRKSEMDCNSLELLFLDSSLSWKDITTHRSLALLGKQHHCTRGTSTFTSDRWLSVLPPAPQAKYQILKKCIHSLTQHTSFASLLKVLYIFVYTELGEDSLNLLPLQMAFHHLRRLASLEEDLTISIRNHWHLFLSLLQRIPYVPDNTQRSISVYPYQVSALIQPKFHFLMNMNHHATRVNASGVSFLSDYLLSQLQISSHSLSDEYFSAYQLSGTTVCMSCSTLCFGKNYPPALPLINAPIVAPANVYHQEEQGWMQLTPLPTPTPWQYEALHAYRQRRSPGVNYRIQPMAIAPPPPEHFSATSLDDFKKKPFAFLLKKYDLCSLFISPSDRLYAMIGNIYHQVLARMLSPFVNLLLPHSVDLAELNRHLEELWEEVGDYSLIPDILKMQAYEYLSGTLITLFEKFQGERVISLEKTYAHNLDKYSLRGKIDLLAESGKSWVIIDYKRAYLPSYSTHSIAQTASIQIPFYLWLLHSHHPKQPVCAKYYSILYQKFSQEASYNTHMMEEAHLRELIEKIISGDFTCPSPGCAQCPFPTLCRRDYLS